MTERGGRSSRWAAVAASAWFGTWLTLLAVLTGALGSLYSTEIRAAVRCIHLTPEIGPWAFLLGVIVTSLLAFWRQRVVDGKREAVQRRFDRAADEIPELVRTLPDVGFLHDFGIVFEKSVSTVRTLDTLESRLTGLTLTLQGFATLAQKFDGSPVGKHRFAANLMIFLKGAAAEPWRPLLKFFDGDPAKLGGVLAFPWELAATENGPDKTIPEFSLPIPTPADCGESKDANGLGWRILPGAPMSFHRRQFEHVARTAELAEWCETSGDFTHHVKASLRQHFASHGETISGFFSVPIFAPSTKLEELRSTPIGVLNIHWNGCQRLENAHAARLFEASTFPLQVVLAQLLVDLLNERFPRPMQSTDVPGAEAKALLPGA